MPRITYNPNLRWRPRRFGWRAKLSMALGRRGMRRFRRRTRRGVANSTQWGRPYAPTRFKKRKIRPRAWRNILIRDTQAKPHYRSYGHGQPPIISPALPAIGTAAVYLFPALSNAASFAGFIAPGQEFWTTNGGAQDIDWGTSIGTFRGDITLRGGISRLSVMNAENVVLRIRVWALWSKDDPWQTIYSNINNSNRNMEWDPSAVPDFTTRFAKILYSKECVLKEREHMEVVHRFRPQKIDQSRFRGDASHPSGNTLWWGLSVVQTEPNDLAAALYVQNSWSLSFSADAIT